MLKLLPALIAAASLLACAGHQTAPQAGGARTPAQETELLLAQTRDSCSTSALFSQCGSGCSAANACRTNAVSHYSRSCLNGEIDPGVAAQRVSLACDACIRQNCR